MGNRSGSFALRENVRKLENDKRFKEAELARMEKNMDSIRVYQQLFDANRRAQQPPDGFFGTKNSKLAGGAGGYFHFAKERTVVLGHYPDHAEFLNKTKNLRDALARIDDVFLSDAARADFEKKITAYNSARDSLYSRDKGFAESVRLFFWNNNEANTKMAVIHEVSIVQFTKGSFCPEQQRDRSGARCGYGQLARLAASKKARKGARKALEQLAYPLNNLQLRIDELMGILSRA